MSILDQIKAASIEARKNRDKEKATFLTTLYSDCCVPGKNALRESSDAEVVSILKKYKNNANIMIDSAQKQKHPNAENIITNSMSEILLVESFMPKTMSRSDLTLLINEIIFNMELKKVEQKHLGVIMKKLKETAVESIDGQMASDIIKQYVNSDVDGLLG